MPVFSNPMYLVDIGYNEETIIYELVPRVVARKKSATLREVIERLRSLNARAVLIPAAQVREADELSLEFSVTRILPPKRSGFALMRKRVGRY